MLFVLAYPDYSLAGIFSGNLSNPTEVAQTIINLTVPSGLTIQTYQFGGLGTAVSGGGIDSVIALFFGSNANATLIAFNQSVAVHHRELGRSRAFGHQRIFRHRPIGNAQRHT